VNGHRAAEVDFFYCRPAGIGRKRALNKILGGEYEFFAAKWSIHRTCAMVIFGNFAALEGIDD